MPFDLQGMYHLRPQSAEQYLQWRDTLALIFQRYPGEIARQMFQQGHLKRAGIAPQEAISFATGVCLLVADLMKTAEFIVWEEDQWQTVLENEGPFRGSFFRDLPRQTHLWTWPTDRKVNREDQAEHFIEAGFDLSALLVLPIPEQQEVPSLVWKQMERLYPDARDQESLLNTALWLISIFNRDVGDEERYAPIQAAFQRTGDVTPMLPRLSITMYRRDMPIQRGFEALAAAFAFLRERIFLTEPLPQSRQTRRAYERANPGHHSTVQQVLLRSVENRPAGQSPGEGRDYQHRWWVGGHFRRRADCWSKGEGPIWVREHIKGPEDAPLVPRSRRISRVVR